MEGCRYFRGERIAPVPSASLEDSTLYAVDPFVWRAEGTTEGGTARLPRETLLGEMSEALENSIRRQLLSHQHTGFGCRASGFVSRVGRRGRCQALVEALQQEANAWVP